MADNDPADQLKKLADLRAQGVLSEAEFTAAKAKVLGGGPATAGKQAPKTSKTGCGCLTVIAVVVLIVIISAVAGSSGSGNAPKNFTVSNASVAGLVKNVINNSSDSPGLAHPPAVNCVVSGARCDIDYTIKEPAGISAGLELIVPTAQIWKGLFEDPRFRSGLITVSGPLISQGGKSSTGPMFTLACNRADANQINWGTVGAHGIQSICAFHQLIQSL